MTIASKELRGEGRESEQDWDLPMHVSMVTASGVMLVLKIQMSL